MTSLWFEPRLGKRLLQSTESLPAHSQQLLEPLGLLVSCSYNCALFVERYLYKLFYVVFIRDRDNTWLMDRVPRGTDTRSPGNLRDASPLSEFGRWFYFNSHLFLITKHHQSYIYQFKEAVMFLTQCTAWECVHWVSTLYRWPLSPQDILRPADCRQCPLEHYVIVLMSQQLVPIENTSFLSSWHN